MEILEFEEVKTLKKIIARSENDFAEGKMYSQNEVKEMLRAHNYEDKVVSECIH